MSPKAECEWLQIPVENMCGNMFFYDGGFYLGLGHDEFAVCLVKLWLCLSQWWQTALTWSRDMQKASVFDFEEKILNIAVHFEIWLHQASMISAWCFWPGRFQRLGLCCLAQVSFSTSSEQSHEHRLTLVRLCDEKRAGSLLWVSASSVCWTCLDLDDLTAWRFARCVDFWFGVWIFAGYASLLRQAKNFWADSECRLFHPFHPYLIRMPWLASIRHAGFSSASVGRWVRPSSLICLGFGGHYLHIMFGFHVNIFHATRTPHWPLSSPVQGLPKDHSHCFLASKVLTWWLSTSTS